MLSEKLLKKAESTVKLLSDKGLKIATAESCTGGMLAESLTAVSGVSEVFELGMTTYSCRIKNEVLGVNQETLSKFGAISENTAREMAENIRLKANSDIGVAVTGVAGPSSSEGHPMGYVFIAAATVSETKVQLLNIKPESRDFVRQSACISVFELLEKLI